MGDPQYSPRSRPHMGRDVGNRNGISPRNRGSTGILANIWGRGFLWGSVSLIRAPKRESDHQRYNGEKLLFGKHAHVKCALLDLEGLGKTAFCPVWGRRTREKGCAEEDLCFLFLCASSFE